MNISGDDFRSSKRRRGGRRAAVKNHHIHLAQMNGGEPEDYADEEEGARQQAPSGPRPYRDDDLTSAGFKLVATYKYLDATGKELLYEVLRYEHPQVPGAKQFRQRRLHFDPATKTYNYVADAGLVKVPYQWRTIRERPTEPVFYVEGEKDVETLANVGLVATTTAGQVWSPAVVRALTARDVVVIPDNDEKGRKNAEQAVRRLDGFASSVRVVRLPGLGRTEDVSDWLEAGHDRQELLALVDATRRRGIALRSLDFGELDPTKIPARDWLYGFWYIRQYLSLLVSTGGIGKSSLTIAELLAMAAGKPLLGVSPPVPLRVWYHNGEDPHDELLRRFAAAARHHKISADDVGDRLFITSGRTSSIVIGDYDENRRARLNEDLIQDLVGQIRKQKIDVVVLDPLVSCHRIAENSTDDVSLVAEAIARIAEQGNCAVMVVHHMRKGNGDARTVEDSRGAVALINSARSTRVINAMTREEAQNAEIEESERRLYFRADDGKPNLARPRERADWYRLVSHDLENGKGRDFECGDSVGVVERWSFPRSEVVRPHDVDRALAAIRNGGPWRLNSQVRREPWVGIPIAQALGRDLARPPHRNEVNRLVKAWIEARWLRVVPGKDSKGNTRDYVEIGPISPGLTGEEPERGPDGF